MAEYIDRKALRDALYDADAITMNGVKILNQFPAADVAPVRHGRYKNSDWMDEWYDHYFICMECGSRFMIIDENRDLVLPNCCPVCMARMDGEKKK